MQQMIHSLHNQQFEVFKKLLCYFLKPERLMFVGKSEVVSFKRLDIENEGNHLPDDILGQKWPA